MIVHPCVIRFFVFFRKNLLQFRRLSATIYVGIERRVGFPVMTPEDRPFISQNIFHAVAEIIPKAVRESLILGSAI